MNKNAITQRFEEIKKDSQGIILASPLKVLHDFGSVKNFVKNTSLNESNFPLFGKYIELLSEVEVSKAKYERQKEFRESASSMQDAFRKALH